MKVKTFIEGRLANNNYLVIDEATNKTILIDATKPDENIVKYIKDNNLELQYILLTHAHFDHVMGINYIVENFKVPCFLHENDDPVLQNLPSYITIKMGDIPKVQLFDEDAKFFVGNIPVKIIHTPGHSPGSCCFLIENYLFSGDTMFFETYGRTDLLGGNYKDMRNSLKRLLTLNDVIAVFPGHNETTTIGHEKLTYKGIF